MIGVAVGLGNVWRFPYMMGKYGGSAFLIIYLLFTLLFAVPALMAEIGLGRATRKGPVGAFSSAFGEKTGLGIGYLLLLTICVASSYYVVVIANVLYSAGYSAIFGFEGGQNIKNYQKYLDNGWAQYALVLILILTCLTIIQKGLKNGIEAVSKLFIPLFLIVLIYLIGNALTLDGAWEKIQLFLKPDFYALKATHVFAALGQAFYSLSLGGTFMLIYGSYLPSEEKIPRIALLTSFGDVGAAMLASLFIVPTVLVFNLDMTSGPTLIFSTLPHLFSQMAGGQTIGTLFLLALGLVAILSLVAGYEVLFSGMNDLPGMNWGPKKKLLLIGILQTLLAFPNSFNTSLIGWLDLIFGSGMQVLGSTLAAIGLSWGMGKVITREQIFPSKNRNLNYLFHFWLSWIIPGILFLVLISYIFDTIITL